MLPFWLQLAQPYGRESHYALRLMQRTEAFLRCLSYRWCPGAQASVGTQGTGDFGGIPGQSVARLRPRAIIGPSFAQAISQRSRSRSDDLWYRSGLAPGLMLESSTSAVGMQ